MPDPLRKSSSESTSESSEMPVHPLLRASEAASEAYTGEFLQLGFETTYG
jgi:hypothetical protein